MKRLLVACALAFVPLAAAAQTRVYLDRSLERGAPVMTVVLFSPDVAVSEISAGGVIEKVPEWSRKAHDYVAASVERLAAGPRFRLIALPPFSPAEQSSLDEHVALYNVVAGNVLVNGTQGGDVWKKRLASGLTDYTVGPGLAFVAQRSGADAALMIVVRDSVSSSGRKAMFVLGALFGVGIPMGRTFAVAGLVDLRTGKLLWQSYDTSVSADLRIEADATKVVDGLFSSYPAAGVAGKPGK